MAKLSKLAKEPASLWLARINAFQRMVRDREPEWAQYRNAVELKFRLLTPTLPDDVNGMASPMDQIALNLSRRYVDRMHSLATDDDPVITYPRDADGDEDLAGMVEKLLGRVVAESGAIREWRSLITSVCTSGCGVVWAGFHADVISGDQAVEVAKGAGEVVKEALAGSHEPAKGQDHAVLAEVLQGAVSDPVQALGPKGVEAILRTGEAAAQHVEAAMGEAKEPQDVAVKVREVWTRWLPVGTWAGWDAAVFDWRDVRWVWRKVLLTKEEARSNPAWNPKVRTKLESKPMNADGLERVSNSEMARVETEEENSRVEVYEVWDKRFRTRHWVAEGVEEYLELDENNPYVDDQTGEPLVPGFFPCVVSTPLLVDGEKPSRTLGLPLLAPGFPQQEELIKFRSYAMACAKRSARIFEFADGVDPDTCEVIARGGDGAWFVRPPTVREGDDTLKIHQWTGDFASLRSEQDRILGEWCALQEFPMAELTTQPVADTATQEQIAQQGGQQRTSFVVRRLEADFARLVEVLRGLVRGFYPDEKVISLMGRKALEKWALWRRSSLDGDRLRVRFAGRAKEENAVKTKQAMDLYTLLKTEVSPLGLPKYRTEGLLEDIARGLGHSLVPYTPTQDELMAALMSGGGQASGPTNGPPGKDKGGPPVGGGSEKRGPPGPPGEAQRREGPPRPQQMNAAAMRL